MFFLVHCQANEGTPRDFLGRKGARLLGFDLGFGFGLLLGFSRRLDLSLDQVSITVFVLIGVAVWIDRRRTGRVFLEGAQEFISV